VRAIIRNVLQDRNAPQLTREQQEFVEDMGQNLLGWGLPRNMGRIYGYLLLQPGPVSLDTIAGAVGLAKSGVSLATRRLVQMGLARGFGERGSRRLLYEALPSLEAILSARTAQALDLAERLRQGAGATTSAARRAQLEELAETMRDYLELAPRVMRQMREQREMRQA
jgi:DNA-binding transcriptional regulator GbsR (MarR family)